MIDDRLNGMNTQKNYQKKDLQHFVVDGTPVSVQERYASLFQLAEDLNFGELEQNIVVIDTETTGLSFNHDELTQIAAARLEHGAITDWFITFVNPGKSIPKDVVRLTDIHDEDVALAPMPSEALAQLVEFVGDAKIVAHNAEFDRTFTTRHPSGYPLLDNIWIDSLDLARIALPRMKSHRLLDLVRAFDAPLSTHRADADVAATCAIFRLLLAGVATMPPSLVTEIASMNTVEQWPTQIVFKIISELQQDSTWRKTFDLEDVSRETSKTDKVFSLRALRSARLGDAKYISRLDAQEIASTSPQSLEFPTVQEISQAFSTEGIVGSLYAKFETRPEQLAMAEAVRNAFEKSENLIVEAGTGVGKSMAYLVPAALTAQKNKITVGVATKTNALLDQLVYHELPALASSLKQVQSSEAFLTFASLKGFSHYPCLRKVSHIISGGSQMRLVLGEQRPQAPALAALLSFIEQTEYDDIDGLKIDYRVLPRRLITSTSHECLRRKCPFFGKSCFVHGARRRAEAADIVVTNHSLMFCDLAADGGLLPPIRHWIVDEAHGAESEARHAFSAELSADSIMRLASRVSADEPTRNIFVRAERKVVPSEKQENPVLFYALLNKARTDARVYADAAQDFSAHLKDLLFFDAQKKGKGYETVELWVNEGVRQSSVFGQVISFGRIMSSAAEKLILACQNLVAYLEDIEGAAEIQREIASMVFELKDQVNAVDIILVKAPETYAYSATISRKKDRIGEKLEALPINVGSLMNDTLYERTQSVVFASATLTMADSFESFESSMGLNTSEASQSSSCKLGSSYDFDAQMTVYVAKDMPEPNDPSYLVSLQELLMATHRAQEGSMLTLFTNRREMERCHDAVQSQLEEDKLRVVCQKWGVSVKALRDDFVADKNLSLFALKSFWEGFDAPGATLKGVIIPKLPFAKPTDPLSCERALRDDQAWRRYVLPAAVLETKQAAGRLIRSASDRGALILADKRLITKGYGKAFLDSLPSKTIKFLTISEIADDLKRNRL